MDIKEQIEKMLQSVTKDTAAKDRFLKDPIAAVKSVLGTLPDDVVEKVVASVKAKLSADQLSDAADALGKLFKK